jgi:putative transposase
MPDHVHLLIRFPSTISVDDFIKEVKGSTSHLVTPGKFFNWQDYLAVYSVSEKDFPKIKATIQHQKEHHTNDQLDPTLKI